jgi:Tfp pilus assembly protein PilP
LILLGYGVGFAGEAAAADLNPAAEKKQDLRQQDTFHYTIENKPDPFLPFLQKDEGRSVPPASDNPAPRLNLKLVGVVSVGDRKIAMVEDAAGKGYYLSEGMRIGNGNWVIRRIKEKQVEMQATYRTQSGRIVTKEKIMPLKEGR